MQDVCAPALMQPRAPTPAKLRPTTPVREQHQANETGQTDTPAKAPIARAHARSIASQK
mgnify:CR=1 FL=1